jgi:RNA polymerase sigma-70 factor (ECF subfamily)
MNTPPDDQTAVIEDAASEVAERRELQALKDGDESAFSRLVMRHHAGLKRVARNFVASDAVAEEVVQETWQGVLEGLDRFEGRSSLRTWIFRILVNRAKTRGTRERRTVPFSSFEPGEEEAGPSVDPDRFRGADNPFEGHWSAPPRPWEDPERRLASLEARDRLKRAIESLPDKQRLVVTLRDVEGLSSEEVCDLLDVSEVNQRVILHRGRSAVRSELEEYLDG